MASTTAITFKHSHPEYDYDLTGIENEGYITGLLIIPESILCYIAVPFRNASHYNFNVHHISMCGSSNIYNFTNSTISGRFYSHNMFIFICQDSNLKAWCGSYIHLIVHVDGTITPR